jgi:hypothetical protein
MKIPNIGGKTPLILGIVLLLVAITPSYYFYSQYRNAQKKLSDPNFAMTEEVKNIVSKVEKHIELPEDETPTLATVSDSEKLKDRPFFSKAKNGDKLLIYTNAKKAILYDPQKDRIIDVGPVNLPSATPSFSATVSASLSPTISRTLKMVLLNGTDTTGLTNTFEKNNKSKLQNIEIIDKDNTKNKTYDKTLIIDLTSNNKDEVARLAKSLGVEISSLPAGESKPINADVLIIIGKDKSK